MNSKSKNNLLMKNNLKLILNTMIPGDNYMPCFTKAVKVETILNKLNKDKFLIELKGNRINLNEKNNWNNYVKILGNFALETYFTSNLVIRALNLRKKDYLKNLKKENLVKLLEKVKYKKKIFRK
jgi:hypothetical protein|tara:strand:+ start:104 stop:478 length:375 start_codon:yes stop_codon:yes gene_type:complete